MTTENHAAELLDEIFGPGTAEQEAREAAEGPKAESLTLTYDVEFCPNGEGYLYAVSSIEGRVNDVRLFRTYEFALQVARDGTLNGMISQPGLASYNQAGPWSECVRIRDHKIVWTSDADRWGAVEV